MNEGSRKARSHNPITAMFDRLNEDDGPSPTSRADPATDSISVPTSDDRTAILDSDDETATDLQGLQG